MCAGKRVFVSFLFWLCFSPQEYHEITIFVPPIKKGFSMGLYATHTVPLMFSEKREEENDDGGGGKLLAA